jgi:hypothetical protein
MKGNKQDSQGKYGWEDHPLVISSALATCRHCDLEQLSRVFGSLRFLL